MKRECFYFTLLWSDFVHILAFKEAANFKIFKKLGDNMVDNCVK